MQSEKQNDAAFKTAGEEYTLKTGCCKGVESKVLA